MITDDALNSDVHPQFSLSPQTHRLQRWIPAQDNVVQITAEFRSVDANHGRKIKATRRALPRDGMKDKEWVAKRFGILPHQLFNQRLPFLFRRSLLVFGPIL